MITLWTKTSFGLIFLIILVVYLAYFKKHKTDLKSSSEAQRLLTRNIENLTKAKEELQFHIDWERHSGDLEKAEELSQHLEEMIVTIAYVKRYSSTKGMIFKL